MNNVIKFNDIPRPDLSERTYKVTLTALSLAMEYYTKTSPDPTFVAEARTSLLRYSPGTLVCRVSQTVHDKVTEGMPAAEAVDSLLFG